MSAGGPMGLMKIHDVISFPERYWTCDYQELFPPELQNILIHLHEMFNSRRAELLGERQKRQKNYDSGVLPAFLDSQSVAVTTNWKVAPIPQELLCRRVEITGPVNSAKMVINMLSR